MSGQVAYGENYFPRPKEEAKIWRYLDRGSHLILLAPRRFGKTSLLRSLERSPKEGYVFLYTIVHSCETEHDYYKRIIEQLYDTDFVSNLQKATKQGRSFILNAIRSIDNIQIADTGITLSNNKQHITHKDLVKVINTLSIEKKLIIILDEYPDVVEKISRIKGHQAATQFLTHARELCQDTQLNKKVQFIFTGSIGLDTLANRLKLSNLINDRDKLKLSPLTSTQAIEFIHFLTRKNKSTLQFTTDSIDYFLQKVEWLILYYLEILWERLEDHCDENNIITPSNKDIDLAYESLFEQHYRSNFNHWAERLQRFEKTEQILAKALLDHVAKKGQITLNEYINISQEKKYQAINPHYVMDCLEHDGYIFETQETIYQFTSPILKDWWNRYADRTL